MKPKVISLFSGIGGFDVGAQAAGCELVAANEYDPAIAAVYRENLGDHIRVGDVLACRGIGNAVPPLMAQRRSAADGLAKGNKI